MTVSMPHPSGCFKTHAHFEILSLVGEEREDYKIQTIDTTASFCGQHKMYSWEICGRKVIYLYEQ